MDDWQPIETAPKDGTFILVTNGDLYAVAAWLAGILTSEQDWSVSFGAGLPGKFKPSHWMPLPKPPTGKA